MHQKIITIAVIILGVLTAIMFLDYKSKNGLVGQYISPNILYITQPATTVSGEVKKIEGNMLTITQTHPVTQGVTATTTPFPTPKMITLTYQIRITERTKISQPNVVVPYYFKQATAQDSKKLSLKDIRIGTYVTVASPVDLRTLSGNSFEASMVTIPAKSNIIYGKISRLNDASFVVRMFVMNDAISGQGAGQSQEREFTIAITGETEISYLPFSNPTEGIGAESTQKPVKLSVSDLKEGMSVSVYTNEDITVQTNVTALRIDPVGIYAFGVTGSPASQEAELITPSPAPSVTP